ncbi:hypothetical protein NG798_10270 [Ancylothrix sp. C2]|uniref:hypothetical protein n=1 Tax=Ancylothrix sp. D3o TaxID=2953691 RepID=UPI0021BAA01E|nr:hypothetical protein [Ancylothrix sp. D3o]MCT7950171.1 hypothetical protein [Ancylothrix sp. D3o]
MAIFRQYIAPLLIVLVFVFALVAVGIRSFLPADMAAPAPIEEAAPQTSSTSFQNLHAEAGLPASLSSLIRGLPEDSLLSGQFN